MNRKCFVIMVLAFCSFAVMGQVRYDSISYSGDSIQHRLQCYSYASRSVCYTRPTYFGFVTQVPKTMLSVGKMTFSKKSLPAVSVIAASTALLMILDQGIKVQGQEFSDDIHLQRLTEYRNIISFKLGTTIIPVYQAPRNLNTAIYSLGEGFTSMVLSGGMFAYGKIKHDYRALQTAGQIVQAQLAVGIVTQTFKRLSGRESPDVSTAPGGVWRPFVSFSNFSKHTSKYDAFPSGHLSTMMATVTVLLSNYPEKKWLMPVGYLLVGMVGFAMINNGVHWASDYPLALGTGYVCGKATVNMNRLVRYKSDHERNFHSKKRYRW